MSIVGAMGFHTSCDLRTSTLFDDAKSYSFLVSMLPVASTLEVVSRSSFQSDTAAAATSASASAPQQQQQQLAAPVVGSHQRQEPSANPSASTTGSTTKASEDHRFGTFPESMRAHLRDLEAFGNSPSTDERKLRFVVPGMISRSDVVHARNLSALLNVRYEFDKNGTLYFRRGLRAAITRFKASLLSGSNASRPPEHMRFLLEQEHLSVEMDVLSAAKLYVYLKGNARMSQYELIFRLTARPELSKAGYSMLFSSKARAALSPDEITTIRAACVKLVESLWVQSVTVKLLSPSSPSTEVINNFLSSVPLWQDLGLYAERESTRRDDSASGSWLIKRRERKFEYYREGLQKLASSRKSGDEKVLIPLPPPHGTALLERIETYSDVNGLEVTVTGDGPVKTAVVRRRPSALPPPPPQQQQQLQQPLAQRDVPRSNTIANQVDARAGYIEVADGQQGLPPGWTCRFCEQSQQYLLFDHLSRKCYRADTAEAEIFFSRQIRTGLTQIRASVEQQRMAAQQQIQSQQQQMLFHQQHSTNNNMYQQNQRYPVPPTGGYMQKPLFPVPGGYM